MAYSQKCIGRCAPYNALDYALKKHKFRFIDDLLYLAEFLGFFLFACNNPHLKWYRMWYQMWYMEWYHIFSLALTILPSRMQ